MKPYILIFLSLLLFISNSKSEESKKSFFDLFNINVRIASKLYDCDKAQYLSIEKLENESDIILQSLSEYRLTFFKDSLVNVIYGKPSETGFTQILNYVSDSSSVEKSLVHFPQEQVNVMFNILKAKDSIIKRYQNIRVELSSFFIINNENIELYILPSWQRESKAVYGLEFYFKYDLSGNELESKTSHTSLSAFDPEIDGKDEIYLNYKQYDVPPVSSLFFVMIYTDYFKNIFIDSKNYKSVLLDIIAGQWAHSKKD